MNKNYLLSLRNRYYNDKKFHKIVTRVSQGLILSDISNDDIVRVADMSAIVALDFREQQKKNKKRTK